MSSSPDTISSVFAKGCPYNICYIREFISLHLKIVVVSPDLEGLIPICHYPVSLFREITLYCPPARAAITAPVVCQCLSTIPPAGLPLVLLTAFQHEKIWLLEVRTKRVKPWTTVYFNNYKCHWCSLVLRIPRIRVPRRSSLTPLQWYPREMENMKVGISPLYCNKYAQQNLRRIKIVFQEVMLTSLKQSASTDSLLQVSRSLLSSKLVLQVLLSGVFGQLWKSKLPPTWFLQSSSSVFCSQLLLCPLPVPSSPTVLPSLPHLWQLSCPSSLPCTPSPPTGASIHVLPGCLVLGLNQAGLKNLLPYAIKLKNNIMPHGHFRRSVLPWQVNSFYESPATILFYLSEARSNRNGRNLLQMST